MTITSVFLDNEWVVVRNDWDRVSKLGTPTLGLTDALSGKEFKEFLQIPATNGTSNLLAEYSAGRFDREAFWNAVLVKAGVDASEANRRALQESMQELITDTDPNAIETIQTLRQAGYRLFMLSNSTPEIRSGGMARHDYFDLFEHCYFSFELACRKPERKIYEKALRLSSLIAEDCVFVDDKPKNLAAAEQVGMQTVHHKIGEGELSEKLAFLL